MAVGRRSPTEFLRDIIAMLRDLLAEGGKRSDAAFLAGARCHGPSIVTTIDFVPRRWRFEQADSLLFNIHCCVATMWATRRPLRQVQGHFFLVYGTLERKVEKTAARSIHCQMSYSSV
jgi:hypothetical protein